MKKLMCVSVVYARVDAGTTSSHSYLVERRDEVKEEIKKRKINEKSRESKPKTIDIRLLNLWAILEWNQWSCVFDYKKSSSIIFSLEKDHLCIAP